MGIAEPDVAQALHLPVHLARHCFLVCRVRASRFSSGENHSNMCVSGTLDILSMHCFSACSSLYVQCSKNCGSRKTNIDFHVSLSEINAFVSVHMPVESVI